MFNKIVFSTRLHIDFNSYLDFLTTKGGKIPVLPKRLSTHKHGYMGYAKLLLAYQNKLSSMPLTPNQLTNTALPGQNVET